jgi:glyoxylase-like metal-dependent hydrolase (beta-lactamase superfamily II)/ferredoxin
MAKLKKILPQNAEGNFYVDSTCINCGVSRHYAPAIFGDSGDFSFVKRQPQNAAEELAAQQALLSCPTASIGTKKKGDLRMARDSFPMEMAKDVYINGFNHRKSYGAHSYFIKAGSGNWLIDSPRFVTFLVRKFENMGGIKYIFLTHQDDVGDAHRFAEHFGATRIIHRRDSVAQKDAELILEGEAMHRIDAAEIYFTPGHTEGHLVLLWEKKYLFTGDHYAWVSDLNAFGSFRDACWYSWDKQIGSVKKMEAFEDVEWVFPGHGIWGRIPDRQFPAIIRQSVNWMVSVR